MDADDGNRLEDTKLTVEEIYQGLVHAASISNATDDSQVAEAEVSLALSHSLLQSWKLIFLP